MGVAFSPGLMMLSVIVRVALITISGRLLACRVMVPGYIPAGRLFAFELTDAVRAVPASCASAEEEGFTVSQLPSETAEILKGTGPLVEVTVKVLGAAKEAEPVWPVNVKVRVLVEYVVTCASAVSG